jgi:hypothetical protein
MSEIVSTQEDFDRYQAHAKWWVNKLNLSNMMPAFAFEKIDSDAEVLINWGERLLLFRLSTQREGLMSIPALAQHEALEGLLGGLTVELEQYLSAPMVLELTHDVIHRLQAALLIPSDEEVGYKKK